MVVFNPLLVSLLNAKWNIQGCESVIFEGEKEMPTTKYKPFYYSCITRLEKKNLTQVFSVASFLYSPFFFKVLRKFHCVVIFIKKSSEIFFFVMGQEASLWINSKFFLGLYLNSGTGLSLIFLVKVLMMVILCLSIYSHWFYPKEMEIIGIFTFTHFDAHAF